MEVEMKMVKSLLLGTAAGFVAVAGAQAADMPVKAAAVQYVKVCNLYGDGFFYMPGTDICIKFGGYVRFEVGEAHGRGLNNLTNWGPFGGQATAANQTNGGPLNTRSDGHDFVYRTRSIFS